MIEVRTRHTEAGMKEYQKFHFSQLGFSGIIHVLLTLILLSRLYFFITYLMGDKSVSTIALNYWPQTAIVVIILILPLFLPAISSRAMCKKNPHLFKTEIRFAFHEEYFTVNTSGEFLNGTNDIKYSLLFKACETKSYFYLYEQQNNAFVIDKNDFVQGTAEDLSALLQKVLPKKRYRKYNR